MSSVEIVVVGIIAIAIVLALLAGWWAFHKNGDLDDL